MTLKCLWKAQETSQTQLETGQNFSHISLADLILRKNKISGCQRVKPFRKVKKLFFLWEQYTLNTEVNYLKTPKNTQYPLTAWRSMHVLFNNNDFVLSNFSIVVSVFLPDGMVRRRSARITLTRSLTPAASLGTCTSSRPTRSGWRRPTSWARPHLMSSRSTS